MEERVVIVNENNEVLKAVPRSVMRADGLLHRASYIIILDAEGKMLIQKRSMQKDVYPGFFDPTTGGVVVENESYEENAIRELKEELGIETAELKSHFDFLFQEEKIKVWGRVFSTVYDGPIEFVDGEVDECFFLNENDIRIFLSKGDVIPDGKMAIEKFLKIRD